MLTIHPQKRPKRAVLTGPANAPTGAALVEDDSYRLYRFIYDAANRSLDCYFERGHLTAPPASTFVGSGEVVRVVLDGHDHHPDEQKRDAFGKVEAQAVDRIVAAIERVVRTAGLLDDVQ